MTASDNEKLWGGRFTEATDQFVETFTASVGFDKRLYRQDIRGSIAHANMLAAQAIISDGDRDKIIDGLRRIEAEIDANEFDWSVGLEDVHMNIEHRLTSLIGEAGKKLHTARSRNDQVATDVRLYLMESLRGIIELSTSLGEALVDQAERYSAAIMPGFTHLQAAQPVTFGHHLLAWFEMLMRDRSRFEDCLRRTSVLPLGSGAMAGTTFPIDRQRVADELGFAAVSENSLDAVSDRDFAIEFCAAASLLLSHLSRWCEELVLWSSQQYSFVTLPDRFCTGSSMMPQKKNPDVPELVRGKSGRVTGNLVALLTLMKGQPLTYNKDNQEDKEPLFDTVDTVSDCLLAMTGLVAVLEANTETMRGAALAGFTTATDLADYLVKKGVPFRDAHAIVGAAVSHAIAQGKGLEDLTLEEFGNFCQAIDEGVYDVLTPDGSVAARDHVGGTAPAQVQAALVRARRRLR